jgi:hypothetical protein
MPNSPTTTQETTQIETICDLTNDLVDGPSCEVQSYQNFANASKATLSFANLRTTLATSTCKENKREIIIHRLHQITCSHINEHLKHFTT